MKNVMHKAVRFLSKVTFLSIAVFGLHVLFASYAFGSEQNNGEGSKSAQSLVMKITESVYGSRRIEFSLSGTYRGRNYSRKGFFIADRKKCFIRIYRLFDIVYEGNTMTSYNIRTKEINIENYNPRTADVLNNPFSIFSFLENSGNSALSYVSVKSGGRNSAGSDVKIITASLSGSRYAKKVVLRIAERGSSVSLEEMSLVMGDGNSLIVKVLKSGAANPKYLKSLVINSAKYGGARINDLR